MMTEKDLTPGQPVFNIESFRQYIIITTARRLFSNPQEIVVVFRPAYGQNGDPKDVMCLPFQTFADLYNLLNPKQLSAEERNYGQALP